MEIFPKPPGYKSVISTKNSSLIHIRNIPAILTQETDKKRIKKTLFVKQKKRSICYINTISFNRRLSETSCKDELGKNRQLYR